MHQPDAILKPDPEPVSFSIAISVMNTDEHTECINYIETSSSSSIAIYQDEHRTKCIEFIIFYCVSLRLDIPGHTSRPFSLHFKDVFKMLFYHLILLDLWMCCWVSSSLYISFLFILYHMRSYCLMLCAGKMTCFVFVGPCLWLLHAVATLIVFQYQLPVDLTMY